MSFVPYRFRFSDDSHSKRNHDFFADRIVKKNTEKQQIVARMNIGCSMADTIQETMAYDFCCWYVKLGNAAEAAERAGFPEETALTDAIRIISRKKYQTLIQKLQQCFSDSAVHHALRGFERLAFGCANDAVQLVFSEECPAPEVLAALDLFNVSEVKRVKGGGIEVRFFDRQKALEKLMEYAGAADDRTAARSLLRALSGVDADEV